MISQPYQLYIDRTDPTITWHGTVPCTSSKPCSETPASSGDGDGSASVGRNKSLLVVISQNPHCEICCAEPLPLVLFNIPKGPSKRPLARHLRRSQSVSNEASISTKNIPRNDSAPAPSYNKC
ncbi:hypothetical protein AJ87_08175 [Rhizobium yanglingense]|nr:hypothetical protein AJ87_08175 [Rhizobium yanglingense]